MKQPTILVVKDHGLMREATLTLLRDSFVDAQLLTATDGYESVLMALINHPDIIIMDLNLPGIDGIEATRRIKHLLPRAKVILFTLSDRQTDRRKAEEVGADGFVQKDEGPDRLVGGIAELLSP